MEIIIGRDKDTGKLRLTVDGKDALYVRRDHCPKVSCLITVY